MLHDVTELVHNVILPTSESDDILGIDQLNNVKRWFIIDNADDCTGLALLHDLGVVPSIITIEGCTFIGSAYDTGVTPSVKRIAKVLESRKDLA